MLISGVFAGCLDDATDGADPPPGRNATESEPTNEQILVEDPEGDAQQYDAKGVGEVVDAHACNAQVLPCGALPGDTLPSEGGIPAHPAFDILSAGMAETPETLIVSIVVAELPEDLQGVLEDNQAGTWDLSWVTAGGGWQNVYLSATQRANGRLDVAAQLEDYCADTDDGNEDCYEGANWWWWSSNAIEYDIEYGAPGTIRLHVPRDAVARGEQADVLELTQVGTAVIDGIGEPRMFHAGVQGAGPYQGGSVRPGLRDGHVDETHSDPPAAYTFQTAREQWSGRDTSARSEEPATTPENAYEDILATIVSDTPQTFSIALEMAQIDDNPVDHYIGMFFSFEGGQVYEGGLSAQEGKRTVWTATGTDPEYRETDHVPVRLDVEPGAPGTYTFTYDRKDLKTLELDERMTMLWVSPLTSQFHTQRHVGHLHVGLSERGSNDLIMANPYWIQNAEGALLPDGETATADDAMFDTTSPTMLDDTQVANFDITQVTVTGIQPDLTRVTLDMRTLDEVLVPVGYDAVFYAVAMATDQGPVMVGYRQDTSDRQDWFCAPDVAVFAENPSDPLKVARTPIQGGLRQGVNDAAPGFVFFVPHSCLGEEAEGPVTVTDWRAGSFLVQNPAGASEAVSPIDEAKARTGVTATFGTKDLAESAIAPSTAWYAEPFGVTNFWDITGLGVALLLAIGGALLVWRRRRLLARYLREVDQAERVKNALARETVLAEIRGHLRTDLTKGRLPESHFMLVDKRIESLIGKARSALFAETFGDLPHRLVGRLEAILADGVITGEERDMASRLVSEARIPASDKKRVLAKLAGWDLEDVLVRA